MRLDSLRRALSVRGITPATAIPDSSGGRAEEASIRPVHLVEGDRLTAVPLGPPQPSPEPLAYLDGIQHSEIVGYAGSSPLVVGEIAAAIRERRDRVLHTVMEARAQLALGRPAALALAGEALGAIEPVPLPEEEPPHPIRDLVNAARALDRRRGALEIHVGERFRAASQSWLLVDGSLSESPRWATDERMVAVSKSHAILPFEGEALERYLRLPPGHRSSVYASESRSLAPVVAWGLRLWPWEGKDLLYGLVRVEVATANGSPGRADAISRWLLAERAPVSAPDPRWDRLLYGIYSVEQYLKSRTA